MQAPYQPCIKGKPLNPEQNTNELKAAHQFCYMMGPAYLMIFKFNFGVSSTNFQPPARLEKMVPLD